MAKGLLQVTQVFTPLNLQKKMKDFGDRGGDLRPWYETAGIVALSSIQKNQFRAGGTPKWPGLKLGTILRRGAGTGGGGLPKPLLDKGILAGSIISGVDTGGGLSSPKLVAGKNQLELSKRRIVIGTNVPYAAFHQFGTVHNVARPYMRILKRDEVIMGKFLTEYMLEGKTKK